MFVLIAFQSLSINMSLNSILIEIQINWKNKQNWQVKNKKYHIKNLWFNFNYNIKDMYLNNYFNKKKFSGDNFSVFYFIRKNNS
jgi:hypothetical protein